MSGNLDALYDAKLAKLAEQKKLSDEMQEMLKKHLVPSSKMACKNMKAAIAASENRYLKWKFPAQNVIICTKCVNRQRITLSSSFRHRCQQVSRSAERYPLIPPDREIEGLYR